MLDRIESYPQGKFSFFPIGSFLLVTIPAELLIGTNYLTVFAIMAYIIGRVSRPWLTGNENLKSIYNEHENIFMSISNLFPVFLGCYSKKQYMQKFIQATLIHILASAVVPIVMLLFVAGFITTMDLSKFWYSHTLLGFALYLSVALLGNLMVHSMGKKTFFRVSYFITIMTFAILTMNNFLIIL